MYIGERFNSYTHLVGTLLSAIGFVFLIYLAITQGDPWKITSFAIYGATLVILYTFSTLYHSVQGKLKRIFQKLDHVSIYLLIAGTYTPFTLVTLRGDLGWTMFAVIWGLATLGIIIDLIPSKGHRIFPLIIYLLMGWLVILILDPLINSLPAAGFYWLVGGGMFYTFGVIFYILDSQHRFSHGIWHLFVLAGSLSHFISVAGYVT